MQVVLNCFLKYYQVTFVNGYNVQVPYRRMYEPWYIGHTSLIPFHDSKFKGVSMILAYFLLNGWPSKRYARGHS